MPTISRLHPSRPSHPWPRAASAWAVLAIVAHVGATGVIAGAQQGAVGKLPHVDTQGERVPLGFPLPAPKEIRTPVGRTVVFRGERHSGTNWVSSLVVKNCRQGTFWQPLMGFGERKFTQGEALGWKHGLLDVKKVSANHIVIIMLRDAASWLPRMQLEPYNGGPALSRRRTMSDFLRAPFKEFYCGRNTEPCYGELAGPTGSHDNVLAMRTAKYRNYWRACRARPANVVCVRFEDLKARPWELLRRLNDEMGLPCHRDEATFLPVTEYRGFSQQVKSTEGYRWSRTDMAAVRSGLDLEMEREMGYTYPAADTMAPLPTRAQSPAKRVLHNRPTHVKRRERPNRAPSAAHAAATSTPAATVLAEERETAGRMTGQINALRTIGTVALLAMALAACGRRPYAFMGLCQRRRRLPGTKWIGLVG